MKKQMRHLLQGNKVLEGCLKIASEDRKVMNSVVKEMEEEHQKDLTRINLLENEVMHLDAEKEMMSQCVALLGKFITVREPNIRYLGLIFGSSRHVSWASSFMC